MTLGIKLIKLLHPPQFLVMVSAHFLVTPREKWVETNQVCCSGRGRGQLCCIGVVVSKLL